MSAFNENSSKVNRAINEYSKITILPLISLEIMKSAPKCVHRLLFNAFIASVNSVISSGRSFIDSNSLDSAISIITSSHDTFDEFSDKTV